MPRVQLKKEAAAMTNETFQAKHPELKGRTLTDQPKDTQLRTE
jgi:hypothetical protein